jgi:hypothetical protein
MAFAAPWVLAGLVFAAVPLVLHLLARREPPTVVFPATRYLARAAREHQRRLRLQHLVLLVVRTLLIVAIVLAAAGPSRPAGSLGTHAPTSLVLLVDNSLSSGAVRAGVPVLDGLRQGARAALERATPDDRLWLVTADGVARPGAADELARVVEALVPEARRLDLGEALSLAARLLETAPPPGEALLLTDLQRSALGPGQPPHATAILRPAGPPVPNAGLVHLGAGVQPWLADGQAVGVVVAGPGGGSRPVSLGFGEGRSRQILVPVGGQGTVRLPSPGPGWWTLEAALDPDELRGDDRRVAAVRVAPPARVTWDPRDRFLATAADVLARNGRLVPGGDLLLGSLGRGPSLVQPPEDPAAVGALNRALAARGSRWQFGDPVLAAATTDSGAWVGRERVSRRHRLSFAGGAPRDVLATVAGEPWLVRSGSILLVGSRLDPDWTGLPLSAGFVPFVDAVANRAARGELVTLDGAPGDPVPLPDRVSEVAGPAGRWPVEGGASFRPPVPGLYFLLAARDTVGALAVNPDPRETDLTPASDAEVRALWPGVRLAEVGEAARVAFAAGARSDLRGPLLWLAAGLLLAEMGLAASRGGARG